MLDFDDDHARVVRAGPFLVEPVSVILDDLVVAREMKALVVVRLEVLIRRLLAETAERLGKVPVEDDERVARVGMTLKTLGQEDVSAQMHGPSPEFSEELALDSLVLDVPGRLGLGNCRNHLVETDDDGCGGTRARLDRHFLRRAVEIARGLVPLLAFAAVHGKLERVAVATVHGLVQMNHCLNAILAGRKETHVFKRISDRGRIDDDLRIGLKIIDVEAEDLLRLGSVVDLEARFVLGIRGKHHEQTAIEGSFADVALEADTNLDGQIVSARSTVWCRHWLAKRTTRGDRGSPAGWAMQPWEVSGLMGNSFGTRSSCGHSNSWISFKTPGGMHTVNIVSLPMALCGVPLGTYTTTPG